MKWLMKVQKGSPELNLIYWTKQHVGINTGSHCLNKHHIYRSSVQTEVLLGVTHDGSSLLSLSPLFRHDLPNGREIPGDASLSQHLHKDKNQSWFKNDIVRCILCLSHTNIPAQ